MIQEEASSRTRLLVGDAAYERISTARVIIFGVGGVGSWCAESLVRSGIGHITIVDSDCVEPSNLNRQLMATTLTLGQLKVEALAERFRAIRPDLSITALQAKYSAETSDSFSLADYDCIIDCIDSLPHKLHLILTATSLPRRAEGRGPHFFSSMGAGRKMDPQLIRTAEFWKVEGCPLARALRNKMKKDGKFPVRKFRCVYAPGLYSGSQPGGTMMHITAQFGLTLSAMALEKITAQE